mgnify:CR=1 FL=1
MVLKLVLIRHGESEWNLKHEFTGWHDCDLTKKGRIEAKVAGDTLKSHGFIFDTAHTSLLIRAIHTLWITLDRMQLSWIPIRRNWRLNERHYGGLQGLEKPEMVKVFGEEQVRLWRRSWDTKPPELSVDDQRHSRFDARYQTLKEDEHPGSESLQECVERTLVYWTDVIVPQLREGKRVLIVAHGNSLRGIVKILDQVSKDDIINLNIPTGVPLVYELDEKNNFRPIKHYYLGNQEEIDKRIEAAKSQAKK